MNIPAHDGADRMKAAFKGCRYAKIRAGAAQGPEKFGIAFGVGDKNAPVRGDQSSGQQIVAGSAVQSGEPAESTAKDETGCTNAGTLSEDGREPIATRCARDLATQHAAFGAGGTARWIDVNALHSGEIDDEAVGTSPSEVAVPA